MRSQLRVLALAADGATHDEVVAHAHDLRRTHVWGALDTLDSLKKGGRIGGAKALLASALAIKPIIEVATARSSRAASSAPAARRWRSCVDKVAAVDGLDSLFVLHADCRDVDQFVAMLRPHVDGEIVVGDIGPVVGFARRPRHHRCRLLQRTVIHCPVCVSAAPLAFEGGHVSNDPGAASLHRSLRRFSPSVTSWSDGFAQGGMAEVWLATDLALTRQSRREAVEAHRWRPTQWSPNAFAARRSPSPS